MSSCCPGEVREQVLHGVFLGGAAASDVLHHSFSHDPEVQSVQPGPQFNLQPAVLGPLPHLQVWLASNGMASESLTSSTLANCCARGQRWSSNIVGFILMYELMLSRWCMHCTWRFRRSTAAFDFVHLFSCSLLDGTQFRTPGVCGAALD